VAPDHAILKGSPSNAARSLRGLCEERTMLSPTLSGCHGTAAGGVIQITICERYLH
jgi:hypothetical protein